MNIEPSELEDTVKAILAEASADLKERITVAGEEVAKECVKTLKQTSPKYTGSKKTEYKPGAYARSWMYMRKMNRITGNSEFVVYNNKHYRLTHLLENGHVNRDGTRARKFIHIAPANNTACKEYERKVEDAIHGM